MSAHTQDATGPIDGLPLDGRSVPSAPVTDAVVASTARIIGAGASMLELGASWTVDTARVVLAQPVLHRALGALVLVEELRRRHVEVPWGGSAESTVCGCGNPWPCEDARLLGGVA